MASGQLSDSYLDFGFYTPNGNWESVFTARVNQITTAGSPDGVIPALKENENFHFARQGKAAYAGCRLQLRFKLNTSDGVDKSDCGILIPVTLRDIKTGTLSTKNLIGSDFGTLTDLPAASITGTFYDFGSTGYTVPSGMEIKYGTFPSTLMYTSIENDA